MYVTKCKHKWKSKNKTEHIDNLTSLRFRTNNILSFLQPNLNYVLWIMASIFGFGLHYVLPQLRKQLPWLCFSHPILKSREYGQFEVRKAAKVMWFEKAFMWLQFLEKAVVFPMVVLSALSMDMDSMRNQMNYRWYSAIILVVCGLKLFRSIFSGKIV